MFHLAFVDCCYAYCFDVRPQLSQIGPVSHRSAHAAHFHHQKKMFLLRPFFLLLVFLFFQANKNVVNIVPPPLFFVVLCFGVGCCSVVVDNL